MFGGLSTDGEHSPHDDIVIYDMDTNEFSVDSTPTPNAFEIRDNAEQCQIGSYLYYLPTSADDGGTQGCNDDGCTVWKVNLQNLIFESLPSNIPDGSAQGSLCGFISNNDGLTYLFHVGGHITEWWLNPNTPIKTTYLFNETASDWIQMTDLLIATRHPTCVGYNDHLYSFSGYDTNQIQIYDFSTDSWSLSTQTTDLFEGRDFLISMMPIMIGSYIVLIGGLTDTNYAIDWIQIYDTNNDTLIRYKNYTLPYAVGSGAIGIGNDNKSIYGPFGGEDTKVLLNVLATTQFGCIDCNIVVDEIPTGNVSIVDIIFDIQNEYVMPYNLSSMAYGVYNQQLYLIGGVNESYDCM